MGDEAERCIEEFERIHGGLDCHTLARMDYFEFFNITRPHIRKHRPNKRSMLQSIRDKTAHHTALIGEYLAKNTP